MAILTTSQLIAGLLPAESVVKASFTGEAAGELASLYLVAGRPGAATAPAGGINGTARSSAVAGQIPFPAAVAGKNVYLAGLDAQAGANIGGVWIMDRLWDNVPVVTTTTSQAIVSPAWPARDLDGATAGRGVLLALEVYTDTTNGAPNTGITVSYTNSAGTAGRTGTITSFPATAKAGTFELVNLAAGDVGVRSVESITLTTSLGGGAAGLVAYRPVAFLPLAAANVGNRNDGLTLGLPRMYDSSVPFLVVPLLGTAAGQLTAGVQFAQG